MITLQLKTSTAGGAKEIPCNNHSLRGSEQQTSKLVITIVSMQNIRPDVPCY